MPLSDDELADNLRDFARKFTASCSYERAVALLAPGEEVHDYHEEPPNEKYFEVEARALYQDADEHGEYVCFWFSAMDSRPDKTLGSVYRPLCCKAYIHANGRINFGPLGNLGASDELRDF
jgi:hypothetical protein